MADDSNHRVSGTVKLPSLGRFYGDKCPTGEVELYAMVGLDEAIIAGMEGEPLADTLDMLLKRCLKTPISMDEMLSTDKIFLALILRANSYGATCNFKAQCYHCKSVVPVTCQIPDSLKINEFQGDDVEPFTVELPITKTKVSFRLLRASDEKDVDKFRKDQQAKRKSIVKEDLAYSYRWAKSVVQLNGEDKSFQDILHWFENLPVKDVAVYRKAYESRISGIVTAFETTCSSCRNTFICEVPLSSGFFRSDD